MDAKITDLQDAKFFKRQGLPLDTPVEHFEFSAAYGKHWLALNKAQNAFMKAAVSYVTGSKQTLPKWKQAKKRLKDLKKAMRGCEAFIGKAKNENEAGIMARFLVNQAMPFVAFWEEAIATAEGGDDFKFNAADVPLWTDPEP